MPCNVQLYQFNGFTIEFLDRNLAIHVVEESGAVVKGANVTIDSLGNIQTGKTDLNGCFLGLVQPDVVCEITINKPCLQEYQHKFILISLDDFSDAESNFPVIIHDEGGGPISGASVSIDSDFHTSSGSTNGDGLFEGKGNADFDNTITVTKAGYGNYSIVIPAFVKIECQETGYMPVPVITLLED